MKSGEREREREYGFFEKKWPGFGAYEFQKG